MMNDALDDDRSDLPGELLRPGAELRETHISWVILEPNDVYKLKKPVDFGFLDFTTLEQRRIACDAEVRLNRRLADDVYYGVVPVVRCSNGRLALDDAALDGQRPTVDWAVHMRRLADADRADSRLAARCLHRRDLARIAARIAAFHDAARADAETGRYGTAEAIGINVRENLAQTQSTIDRYLQPDQARAIERYQLGFLDRNRDRFALRVENERVRDGHGDLRLDHVYLEGSSKVTIVDCIEFNDRFRYGDVASDVAFLAMDLTWHGYPDLAEGFLADYARSAGDFDLYPLIDFYESYRAYVRGKVSAIVALDAATPASARRHAAEDARRYFLLALASGRRALIAPQLIAVGGLIASGKSTVAAHLSAQLAAPIVDSDGTRKQRLGVAPTTPVHVKAWQGPYDEDATAKVYEEVFRRADQVLASGRSVILDASFRTRAERALARALAERHSVPFHFVECRAEPAVCRARLEERDRSRGVSDGRLEIFDDFAARWQPVDELSSHQHLALDTALPDAEQDRILKRRLDIG